MGIIAIALSAALVYGAADFLGGLASRRTSTLAVVVWSQAAGFLVLAVALPLSPGTPQPADLAWGALCGVIGAGAVGLLYRGLAIGAMGVVSPITAVLAAVLPVAYGSLRHTRPSLAASMGIALSLVAVIAISAVPPASRQQARRGIGEALAITTLGRRSGPNASSTDSAPAIEPKSCITKSDMQSPSRLRVGMTIASPADAISSA
jgi:hypothetical protein